MRLLRSRELTFVEFEGEFDLPYAILSHVWYKNGQEVTYEEMKSGTGKEKSGYDKIVQCGKLAASTGYDFFWIDTCCIDKRSSADLSEAINSMFSWYQGAAICYAYLADVPATSFQEPFTEFKQSRWFERGWTLQELLAPSNILFLSKEWIPIGKKSDLSKLVCERTKINEDALTNKKPLNWFSVAERMSWAAFRQTTRLEDRAYSLMGIFGVHMSLLYGEKGKAFIRLQQKIMKTTADQSLFAWKDPSLKPTEYIGLLAKSPDCFNNSACYRSSEIYTGGHEAGMAKGGISAFFYVIPHKERKDRFYACLDCTVEEHGTQSPAILLTKLDTPRMRLKSPEYARVRANEIIVLKGPQKSSGHNQKIFVRQDVAIVIDQRLTRKMLPRICIPQNPDELAIFPAEHWDPQSRLLFIPNLTGKLGGVLFALTFEGLWKTKRMTLLSIFGVNEGREPWIHVVQLEEELAADYWLSYQYLGKEQDEAKIPTGSNNQVWRASIEPTLTPGPLLFYVNHDLVKI